MNLQEFLIFLNYIINKEQSGKFISPNEYSLLLQRGSLKYFKKYFDVPEEYQIGMPMSRIQYEITDTVKKKMARFMKSATKDDLGMGWSNVANIPTDLFQFDFFEYTNGVGRQVKGYQYKKLINSSIKAPTESKPIMAIINNQMNFNPRPDDGFLFHYLRYPNTPNYDFYVDDNDNIIYLPPGSTVPQDNRASTSVELDWDIESIWDIAELILQDIGMSINRGEVIQYANQRETEGV